MARNFREQQARNKRNTFMLIFGFSLFLAVLGYVFGFALGGSPDTGLIGAGIGLALAVVMSLHSVFAGSDTVLFFAGAHEIRQWRTPEEQSLFNVTEEMAIAAGLPRPRVFIIDDPAPNAFACGRTPKTACVAVTRGLLEKLNREELQAVVAHEMGHVRNYDILYTVVVAVLVGVVVILADFFLRSLFWGGHSRGGGDNKGQAIMLVIGLVLAILAPILAQLLYFAVSRQREYLADATAVELTRNPKGLENALLKISAAPERLQNANRGTAHLYIINPMKKADGGVKKSSAFATHPPIEERVKRLREMSFEPTTAAPATS